MVDSNISGSSLVILETNLSAWTGAIIQISAESQHKCSNYSRQDHRDGDHQDDADDGRYAAVLSEEALYFLPECFQYHGCWTREPRSAADPTARVPAIHMDRRRRTSPSDFRACFLMYQTDYIIFAVLLLRKSRVVRRGWAVGPAREDGVGRSARPTPLVISGSPRSKRATRTRGDTIVIYRSTRLLGSVFPCRRSRSS